MQNIPFLQDLLSLNIPFFQYYMQKEAASATPLPTSIDLAAFPATICQGLFMILFISFVECGHSALLLLYENEA